MPSRKKLIEVALPLEAINVASAREKSIRHGHPSTLHLWWARRPLAACRAVIFSSLVDDPDDPEAPKAFVDACKKLPAKKNALANDTPRMRLFDFIETLVQWESTTDEKVLDKARKLILLATDGNPPPLLDPFAGGGSIPLEAQRLGLETYASDLNPVAVIINKAQIEIPPRFANQPPVNPRDRAKFASRSGWNGAKGLAADVRYYGEWMREKAWEQVGHLYPKHNGETIIAWIWARTVKSPNPALNVHVPLVRSFELSRNKKRKAWVEPEINPTTKEVSFKVHTGEGKAPVGTVNRRGAICIVSGVPIPFDYIRSEAKSGRMGQQLMAIVTEGKSGRSYYAPTVEQEQVANVAIPVDVPATDMPDQALGFRVQSYGMTKHIDMFTARQLKTLAVLSEVVKDVFGVVKADALEAGLPDDDLDFGQGGKGALAYAQAIATYLGLTPSKAVRFSSTQSFWRADENKLSRGFGRQTVSMTWDFAETNPFSDTGGDFEGLVNGTADVLEKVDPFSAGTVVQHDAGVPLDTIIGSGLISTDPPYYDNVSYADLSDIFYVWLRKSLRDIFPELFSTILVPKSQEMVAEPFRFGGKEKSQQLFETRLNQAFTNMQSVQNPSYPLTVYYAYKQSETDEDDSDEGSTSKVPTITSSTGWETMLEGLVKSGFQITGTLPIRTEGQTRMRSIGSNALASSIVLVCRSRSDNALTSSRRGFVDALRREIPVALKELQSGNIAPVDLAQASIGPGMAVYSRYKTVLEADGSRLSVRTALQLINQELDAYLAEQEGNMDADTRFALSWFEQFGFDEGAFGQADVLARAKNTSVQGVVEAFIARAGQGKVQLYTPTELYEYNANWSPAEDKRATVWEATHHLIERLNRHSESGAAMLVAKMPDELSAEARALAYRLYNICERKGWADYARDYNALVISWPQITALAVEQKNEPTQASLFGEE